MYRILTPKMKLTAYLICAFMLGWFTASYERSLQIIMPEIVEVGDVLFTGTYDAPYRICVYKPY